MIKSSPPRLQSCLCTQTQLESETFQAWAQRMGEPSGRLHRKIWEWCYIAQGLHERGLLRAGCRGLGFAVGEEPLPSLLASYGCDITATDLELERAAAAGWYHSHQHARNLAMLNQRRLCEPGEFARRVSLRPVDMNRIPADLRGYDFTWSACSLEHLGSIARGEQFVYNSLACLRPGGVAIHTTEFTVSSNTHTVDYRDTVLYRRRDMERLAENLTAAGQTVEPFDFQTGGRPVDQVVDAPPYRKDQHLKLLLEKQYVCTSVGFIITKSSDVIPQAPKFATPRTLRVRLRPARRWLQGKLCRLRSAALRSGRAA